MNPLKMRYFPMLAMVLACGARTLSADTVTLKDGTQQEGIITIQTATKLVLKQEGKNTVIRLDDIVSITRSEHVIPDPTPPPRRQAPAPVPAAASRPSDDPVASSTVKVFTTISAPDVRKPWAKLPPKDETGSGFVISNRRILTSAHYIVHATDIQVCGNKAGDKVRAHVIAADQNMDLALLGLDDDSFFDTHPPLNLISIVPKSRDMLQTYGYSGDSSNATVYNPSVTTLSFETYSNGVSGLAIKINSDLAAGWSGGPVAFGPGNVMGMVSSRRSNGQSYTFVIPASELNQFLDRVASGASGKSMFYDQTQALENPALREFVGLDSTRHGVVVTKATDNEGGSLHNWDVLKAVSHPIDDQGTVPYSTFQVGYGYEFQQFSGLKSVAASVYRRGADTPVNIPLVRKRTLLIPDPEGAPPSYFIFGPIVFSTVTTQVTSLVAQGGLEAVLGFRGSPLVTRRTQIPAFAGEQLVFVPAGFFPSRLARGYGDPTFTVVKEVNGIPIKNLIHLVQVLRDATDEFVTIEFVEKDTEILVFPRAEMIAATEGILGDNNVRSQGSADTMAVWNAK